MNNLNPLANTQSINQNCPATDGSQNVLERSTLEISDQLSHFRNRIQRNLKTNLNNTKSEPAHSSGTPGFNEAIASALCFVQQQIQTYLQNQVNRYVHGSISPSGLLHFVVKRPVLVGAVTIATVLIGPLRLAGWLVKAAAILRLASIRTAR